MNLLEKELNYPLGDAMPEPGKLMPVCDGVYWLRMKLPFALNHINCWLLEDGTGWTIVDCGIGNDETRASWTEIFNTGLLGKPVKRVIATHCHPDHLGSADWLCQCWEAPLWMSVGEYGVGRMMQAGLAGVDGAAMIPFFIQHGLSDPALITKLGERREYYQTLVPAIPSAFMRMQEGQRIKVGDREWQVITGFGHSPEHVCLFCPALNCLIAGDMLLPRISTNVSVWPIEPLSNPVQQFMDSIIRYRTLPADVLVLPSHGKPFTGAHRRVQQLIDHHQARLAEVLAFCVTPKTAGEIVPLMFTRPLDTHQLTFALGEALGHCHCLWLAGALKRQVGEDGIIRFASY